MSRKIIFSKVQKKIIHDEYLITPIKTLARKLGVSQLTLRNRLNEWGLIIPKHIIEERKKQSQFSKGQISFNKGKNYLNTHRRKR